MRQDLVRRLVLLLLVLTGCADHTNRFANSEAPIEPRDGVLASPPGVGLGMATSGLVGAGNVIPPEDETGPRPYLHAPTSTSMWISWWTSSGTESRVDYGTNGASLTLVATGTTDVLATNKTYYHAVKLSGLSPNSRYYYRVRTGANQSQVYRFRTLPADGDRAGHFRFLVIGDHQIIDQPRHTNMIAAARDKLVEKFGGDIEDTVRFIVNLGDQVDVGNIDHWQNLHFKQSALLTPYIPIMTIVGNHELYYDTDLALYKTLFHYDGLSYAGIVPSAADSERYYAFRAANTLFVMTDTEHPTSAQTSWVDRLVTAAAPDSTVDWVFTLGHRPYQAEQYVGDISTWIRETVTPILVRTSKSALLVGAHHHLYARGQRRNEPLYEMISGGTAWDQYWGQSTEVDYDDVQKTIDFWPYQIVDIDQANRDMSIETWAMGSPKLGYFANTLIDTIHRKHGQASPSKPSFVQPPSLAVTLPYTFTTSTFSSPTSEPLNSTQFQVAQVTSFTPTELDVYRDYEDLFGTTGPSGSPAYWWVDKNAGVDITKLTIAGGQIGNGRHYVRARHRDRNLEWSAWSDAVAFDVQGSVSQSPTVTLPQKVFPTGSSIPVSWGNGPGNARDWIGIYKEGDTPGSVSSASWAYVTGTSGTLSLSLSASQLYWVNLFENDGYKELAPRVQFYYGAIPGLTTSASQYSVGASVKVSWSNAPALAKDWVGIYKAGQTPGGVASTAWSYVGSKKSGSKSFTGLAKGYYFATYLLRDGYFEPSARVSFQIGTQISTLSANGTTFSVGTPITFYFSDGPATPKDYVGIFQRGATPGVDKLVSYLYVGGTASGSVTFSDLPAGTYFAALYINDSYTEASNHVDFSVGP